MKLQITTDYAIRIIGYLAQNNTQIVTANDMAKKLGITYHYLNKLVSHIKRSGLIESVKGPAGGYRLSKSAEDITLYDIIQIMEGDILINHCLEEDGYCSRNAAQTCPVQKIFASVQYELVTSLKSHRISDIWKMKEPLEAR